VNSRGAQRGDMGGKLLSENTTSRTQGANCQDKKLPGKKGLPKKKEWQVCGGGWGWGSFRVKNINQKKKNNGKEKIERCTGTDNLKPKNTKKKTPQSLRPKKFWEVEG